jgi:hypothetical protein
MEHIHFQRKGDQERFLKYRNMFKTFSNKELIDSYNHSVDSDIIGSHQHALYLISIGKTFNSRFGKSPINIDDNNLISLSGKIVQEGGSYKEHLSVKLHLTGDRMHYIYIDSIVDSDSDFVDVKSLTKGDKKALLIRSSHPKINTQLILTDVTSYVLIYFDKSLKFKGASYSVKNVDGSFAIQTQYKTILLVKLPLYFELKTIIKIRL